jgi:hypothetical protein
MISLAFSSLNFAAVPISFDSNAKAGERIFKNSLASFLPGYFELLNFPTPVIQRFLNEA